MKRRFSIFALTSLLLGGSISIAAESGSAPVEVRKVKPADPEILEEWQSVTPEPDIYGAGAARVKDARWPWQVSIHAAEFVRGGELEARLEKAVTAKLRGISGVNAVIREDREVWRLEGDPKGEDVVRACVAAIEPLAPEIRKRLTHDDAHQ